MTRESETSVQGMPEARALRYVDLSRTTFATDASSLLPEETARRFRAVPIERRGDVTLVAVSSPANPITMEALREGAGCDVTTVVASPDQVTTAIAYLYGGGSARSSRRRGQHAAGEGPDGPAFEAVRFATSEALLASPVFDSQSLDGESPTGAVTLEESLRSVLVPPDADRHLPPVPEPPVEVDDAVATPPTSTPPTNGSSTSTPPTNGSSTNGSSAVAPPANGTSANGSSANGAHTGSTGKKASATGTESKAASTNGTSPTASAKSAEASAAAPADEAPGDASQAAPTVAGEPAPHGDGRAAGVSTGKLSGSDLAPMEDPNASAAGTGQRDEKSKRTRPPHGDAHVQRNGSASDTHVVPAPPAGEAPDQPAPHQVEETPVPASRDPGAPPPPPPGFGTVETDPATEAASVHWPPLARVLVRAGKVSFDQMVQALRAHKEAGEPLARYLFSQKLATEDDLVEAMAEEVGLEFVDLTAYPVDPNVAALIPESVARRHMVLPLRLEDGVPVVAMANPTDVFAMDDLRSIMGRNFTPVVATRSQIDLHLRQLQESSGGDVQEAAQSAAGAAVPAGGGFELESLQSVVEDAPIVRYVNLLILQALNERASDIHIEPTPKRLRIRFRIDGVMHDASSASPAIHQAVISRLKVLGEMDITEHRVPQEGRVSVSVGERQIDLRLAILPSQYGETCVMRLLDKSASIRRLSELGFFPDTLERYANAYNHPYGVILVTGPTGAGKTTTLYATLQEVMSSEKSVVTVEDPVEYQIDGITQVQINAKVGLHFSTALRSILRADPDIILVGEIRDIETASIAMEAALSGHLVLSTLHTNTAAGTPLRLTEMGIEPFLVTSAVGGVLTQRLARILCEKCKTPYSASLTDFYAAGYREVDLEGLDVSTLYRAAGCRTCSHTGYHGRMLLAEVMPISEEIERMIIEQQSIVAIERQAVEQGMRTLRQDGLRKALAGFTTLEEVLRVVV
jgi:type IV pilus assembly protein PilB